MVFRGDLVDRGPDTPGVLRLVISLVEWGAALCVPGNHDVKLMRKLRGRDVQITHGLAESLAQLESEPVGFKEKIVAFIDDLVSHYVLDGGKLVVAHAGMKPQCRAVARPRFAILRCSARRRARGTSLDCRFDTTGPRSTVAAPGSCTGTRPYRNRMAEWNHQHGHRMCVRRQAHRVAMSRRELVSVPAERIWCQPAKPFLDDQSETPVLTAQQSHDDSSTLPTFSASAYLDAASSQRYPREENASAALEVMSRFAADPKWLIYLPPTMAPCETADLPGMLEHPSRAFAYYRTEGVPTVICQEKHMGSRGVDRLSLSRGARRSFGINEDESRHLRHEEPVPGSSTTRRSNATC